MKKQITLYDIETFVQDKLELERPGTNDKHNIYYDLNKGTLHSTRDSMEYRDDDKRFICTFEFKNEYAPYSEDAVIDELIARLENRCRSIWITF